MIDNDYTEAIRIVIHNLNNHTVPIVRGCKVAQIIIERIYDGHEIQVVMLITFVYKIICIFPRHILMPS